MDSSSIPPDVGLSANAERRAALSGLAHISGIEFRVFDELFPSRPWADVVPEELWYRREVLEHHDAWQRYQLYKGLEGILGSEHASTIMVPPVPWNVLAPYGVYTPMVNAA